jgi:FKBP-type peptidyl-prolyl cis-trans isomerase
MVGPVKDKNMHTKYKIYVAIFMVLTLSVVSDVLAQNKTSDNKSTVPAGMQYWNDIEKETIETSSGLQYKILIAGNGRKPKRKTTVKVHYRGLLLDGRQFDSSFDSDEPVEFRLTKVIKGWTEGIQLMPAGSVFVFLIPPELAYGEKGAGVIPPDATLIFEVELFGTK